MDKPIIYTIGHSSHTQEFFLELLRQHMITYVVDVRSVPASSYAPHFNKEYLHHFLNTHGIIYEHMPEEFGARCLDPDMLDDDGRIDFERVQNSWVFKQGIDHLWHLIEVGNKITLMCSESEPFDCHRFAVISNALEKDGIEVQHILKDKSLISNAELEERLLVKYDKRIPKPDMFTPEVSVEEQLRVAYRLRNKDIGYSHHPQKVVKDIYD